MLSYHNDQSIKDRIVAQAKRHRDLDMLVQGTYDNGKEDFKACSVGCFAHELDPTRSDYHRIVAQDAGWPVWLVRMSDSLFESLPTYKDRVDFHVELREGVPVGIDLNSIQTRLVILCLEEEIKSLEFSSIEPYSILLKIVLQRVLDYCYALEEDQLAGLSCTEETSTLRSCARSYLEYCFYYDLIPDHKRDLIRAMREYIIGSWQFLIIDPIREKDSLLSLLRSL